MLIDAACRVGAMHVTPDDDSLFVPVRIGRIVTALTQPGSSAAAVGDWEIRSSPPKLEHGDARWERTEVVDPDGQLRLLVEHAAARRLTPMSPKRGRQESAGGQSLTSSIGRQATVLSKKTETSSAGTGLLR